MEKPCGHCKVVKDVSNFYKSSKEKTGYQSYCKDCKNLAFAKYMANKSDEHKQNCKQWDVKNKQKRLEIGRKWAANNPDKIRLKRANRRAKQVKATPEWLSDFDKLKIKCFYQVAQMRTKESGEEWHIDHIIPLRGKTVSGLHVPWNMQIIRGSENLKKHNKLIEA